MLVGVGGREEGWLLLCAAGRAVWSAIMLAALEEEMEEELLLVCVRLFSHSVGGSGKVDASVGDVGGERCAMAIMALVASEYFLSFVSFLADVILALSMLTKGSAAEANDRDLIAFGASDGARFCAPVVDGLFALSLGVAAAFLAVNP